MAIKGLTNRSDAGSFPVIGKIRKGGKRPDSGKAPGRDLDYFRFDSSDARANQDFVHHYGDEPRLINVLLPYAKTSENFFTAKESYVAGGLRSRCDGESVSAMRLETGQIQRQFIAPVACPGANFCKDCKNVGRLSLIIPELKRFSLVTVETHSVHDIINIDEQLRVIESTFGRLNSIPLILTRSMKSISTPRDGKRVRVDKSLLSIEVNPDWAALQLAAAQTAQLAAASVYSLAGASSVQALPLGRSEPVFRPAVNPSFRETSEWFWFESEVARCIRENDGDSLTQVVESCREWESVVRGRYPALRQAIDSEHDRAIQLTSVAPKSVPVVTQKMAHPNVIRLSAIRSITSASPDQIKRVATDCELELAKVAEWDWQSIDGFRNTLFCDWGMDQGVFDHPKHCANAFRILLPNAESDVDLWELWIADIARRKLDKSEEPESTKAAVDLEEISNPF